jgi:hypothetical protein
MLDWGIRLRISDWLLFGSDLVAYRVPILNPFC